MVPPTPQKTKGKEPRPSTFKVWLMASRPHTLTLSMVPVLVGHTACVSGALSPWHISTGGPDASADEGDWTTLYKWQWLLFCILVQLATNLHNDYADFVKGADTETRVGQARATQKGWLSPDQTCRASHWCLCMALAVGTSCLMRRDDPLTIVVVLSSLFNAIAYTGGPYPPLGIRHHHIPSIGYNGLGDVFVFLYFGLVATLAPPYIVLREERLATSSSSSLPWTYAEVGRRLRPVLPMAIPVSLLATAVLVVNNLRDRHTDVQAGKRTTAVRFGGTFSRIQYAVMVVLSYVVAVFGAGAPLVMLSLPLALSLLKAVSGGAVDGSNLNPYVGATARLQLIFCGLMCLQLRFFPSGGDTGGNFF